MNTVCTSTLVAFPSRAARVLACSETKSSPAQHEKDIVIVNHVRASVLVAREHAAMFLLREYGEEIDLVVLHFCWRNVIPSTGTRPDIPAVTVLYPIHVQLVLDQLGEQCCKV